MKTAAQQSHSAYGLLAHKQPLIESEKTELYGTSIHEMQGESQLGTRSFCLLLAAFVLVCFAGPLLGLNTFVHRDFGLFGYPLAHHLRESLWQGELPLWNPYSNCGLPFLAQWNTMSLYPPSLIYVLLPMPWSLNVFCVAHLFLAGVGMFILAREWTKHELGSALAGIAFAFNGLTVCALMWPNNIAALGWMPWVVWAAARAWTNGGRGLLAAAAIGALQMLAGAPEFILFTWAIAGGVFLVDIVHSRERRQCICRFGLLLLIVVGITAAQLLPFLQLLVDSDRGGDYSGSRWSMPSWGWANLLVPLFRMNESASGVYFQMNQGWTSSYYCGAGVLAFAVIATLSGKEIRVWVLAAAAALALVLALGEAGFVYPWFRKLFPFVGFMRYPIKFVACAMFAIPLLAAFGVAAWQRVDEPRRLRLACVTVVILTCLVFGIVAIAYVFPLPEQQASSALWSGVTRVVFLIGIVAAVWWHAKLHRPSYKLLLAAIAATLVWVDAATHMPQQNPTVDNSAFDPELLKLAPISPKPQLGQSRAMLSLDTFNALGTNTLTNPLQHFLLLRLWQFENLNLLERIPKIDGFYSLYPAAEREVHFRLYGADNQPRPGLADFLGVSQVTRPAANRAFAWHFRETHLPMLTLHASPMFLSREATLANLMSSSFDPRRTVFLSTDARERIAVTNGRIGKLTKQTVSPHEILAEIETEAANLLVVAQTHYPAWKAYLDGRPVSIHRANRAFQAVEVPAGHHVVVLRYEDKLFRIGLGISVVMVLAIAFSCFAMSRRRSPSPGY